MKIQNLNKIININNLVTTYKNYTFRNISNGSCSIIDYLLTDLHSSRILEHKVLGGDLGTSAQTAHKALFSKIRITMKVKYHPRLRKRPAWHSLTDIVWSDTKLTSKPSISVNR